MKILLIRPNPPTPEEITKKLKASYKEGWFSNDGPAVRKLSEKYKYHTYNEITLVNNATSGLIVLLKSLDLKGTDILVPSFTFPATVHAIQIAGYKPVFVDICSDLYMCPEKTEQALKKMKSSVAAIMPVFSLGYDIPCAKFRNLALDYGVECIFDAAACFTMKTIPGNVVYSLHITKSNGIGEGGIVQCDEEETLEKVRKAINFGMDDDGVVSQWGTNAKMSDFQAAVGLASYGRIRTNNKLRGARFNRYINKIENTLIVPMDGMSNHQTFPVLVHEDLRDSFKKYMEDAGVGTKVYYKSLHEQPYFEKCTRFGDLDMSSLASKRILCLPLYDTLTREEQTYIIEKINDFTGV